MKIAVTGHRPDKLNSEWDGQGPVSRYIFQELYDKVKEYRHEDRTCLISGMALGVDQIFARVAIAMDLPLIAAIPCFNHDCKWPSKSKQLYNEILSYKKCEQYIVCKQEYEPWVMQKRNEWMVNNCDLLIACYNFDGKGGTHNCIEYCKKKEKPIYYIDIRNETNKASNKF